MVVDNLSSAVVYEGVFPGAALEYIVSSNKIKENIIVREPQQEYLYHFDVSLGGLIPVPQEDGSIFLLKDTQDSEPLFIIEAPYMFDAAGEASIDVKMHFAEDGTLVLEADPAWVNAEERVYPVYIDPTFTHARETKATEMAYVSTAAKNTNYSGQLTPEMYVGNGLLGIRRTYMRITLPSIPKVSVINSALLTVNQTNIDYSPAGLYLQVYQVPANSTYGEWVVGDVNWNNQPMGTVWQLPSNRATLLDQKAIVNNNKATYSFNIKNAVVKWRDTGINSGLAVQSHGIMEQA